jgi:hypothetical protein
LPAMMNIDIDKLYHAVTFTLVGNWQKPEWRNQINGLAYLKQKKL